MPKKSSNQFVQNILMKMETALSELEPIYEKNVVKSYQPIYEKEIRLEKDILLSGDFIIKYEDGSFIISFSYDACPILIAEMMKKLCLKFKVEIGEPFYISSSESKMYWGCECQEKYFADLKKEFLNEKSKRKGERHLIKE